MEKAGIFTIFLREKMFDTLGRNIDYLRISITDRCNLRCTYCMPDAIQALSHAEVLRYEELLQICRAAAASGIKYFKVTGGEPLVRKGAANFLAALKKTPGVEAVTLTTNGCLLAEELPALKAMGLDGINISLDTLDTEQYRAITGFANCAKVVAAIKASVGTGIPTKVNVVLLKENRGQILPLAALAETLPIAVRFIELMPLGYGTNYSGPGEKEVFALLQSKYADLIPDRAKRGNGPAVYYKSTVLKGTIGFISANTHRFCAECNRMRLTSTGFLKPCLCYSLGVDLRAIVREEATEQNQMQQPKRAQHIDKALQAAFKQAADIKPEGHCFARKEAITEHKSMNQIGG